MSKPEENFDFSSLFWQKIKPFWLPIVLIAAGSFTLFSSFYLYLSGRQDKPSMVIEQSATESATAMQYSIKVDVEGAVVKPGVYELDKGDRIQNALILAGGFDKKADADWITKNLNLAAKLTDGAKIYVPFLGEKSNSAPSNPSFSSFPTSNVPSLINVNTASQSDLESLPGVGPVTAQKIIAGRPYEQIEDLLTRKIVGKSVFEKIKEKISVY